MGRLAFTLILPVVLQPNSGNIHTNTIITILIMFISHNTYIGSAKLFLEGKYSPQNFKKLFNLGLAIAENYVRMKICEKQ